MFVDHFSPIDGKGKRVIITLRHHSENRAIRLDTETKDGIVRTELVHLPYCYFSYPRETAAKKNAMSAKRTVSDPSVKLSYLKNRLQGV